MSSQNQGRQSPDPEREFERQKDAPSSGQGVSDPSQNNNQEPKNQFEGLSSNPKGVMDDEVTKKFSKSVENTKS